MRVSIDTRTIQKGDYFIPIKGQNFDGHDFIDEALKKGAHILPVDLPTYAKKYRKKLNFESKNMINLKQIEQKYTIFSRSRPHSWLGARGTVTGNFWSCICASNWEERNPSLSHPGIDEFRTSF